MMCCRSCKKWAKSSKKVPIDVRKVAKVGEFIEIGFKDKVVKIPAWNWKTEEPISLRKLSMLRICFYGKGVIEPWSDCEKYEPEYPNDLTFCRIGDKCEYSKWCPKYQNMISYIT